MSVHCGTKVKHATRDAAMAHIKQLLYRNHLAGESHRSEGLAPYPCDECDAWHVGHHARAPIVWHYTVAAYLKAILKADALTPAKPRRKGETLIAPIDRGRVPRAVLRRYRRQAAEPEPLLWFSRNSDWEYSVMKAMRPHGRFRAVNEIAGEGLLRFGVPASFATLRWADYLRLNPTPPAVRAAMERIGNPNEWLATNAPVPLQFVRTIEVYYGVQGWVSVTAVSDEAFARYLAERGAVYEAAQQSLIAKVSAHTDPEQPLALTEAEDIVAADWEQSLEDRRP